MEDCCWSEEPPTMNFDSEIEFQKFCSEVAKLQRKILAEQLYDSVSSFINFYRDYKAGKTPMPEHYRSYTAKHDPDSLSCVGNAIVVREGLLTPESYLMEHYPDLERYLYYSCSNVFCYSWLEQIPEEYQERPPMDTAVFKEHVLVTLKISCQGRDGYVLMDTGHCLSFPVVVMADGMQPQTEPFKMFWRKGATTFSYKLQGSYVHWTESPVSENPGAPKNRWIYVARKFNRMQEIEKRNLLSVFHAVIARAVNGPPTGCMFCVYGHEQGVFINNNSPTNTVVPFDYLLADRNDNVDYETMIDKCAIVLRMDREEQKGKMKALAEINSDKTFMQSLLKLDNEYYAKFEKCWGDSVVYSGVDRPTRNSNEFAAL